MYEGVVERLIEHKAQPSALVASRPCPRAILPVLHECMQWFNCDVYAKV